MRILSSPSSSKVALVLSFAFSVSAIISGPLIADDKPEPRIISASESVEIVRIAIGLTQVMDLQKKVTERFSKFESEFLFDLSTELPGIEKAKSDVSFGQCIGVVLPDFENYYGMAIPVEVNELFTEEDYELGEDTDGNLTIDGQIAVKTDRYFSYAAVSDETQLENSTQIARQLIDYVIRSETHLLVVEASPVTIGRSLLKSQLMGYKAALATEAQRHDDESDFDYSWRSLSSGHFANLVELFFRDVEKLSFRVSSTEPSTPFVFEVAVDCRKDSPLLGYFQEMKQRRNRALSWLHPDADAFATVSMALPERVQEQLLTAGRHTAESLRDEVGLNAQAAGQTEGVFQGLADSGAFEVLLQQVPFDENSACYVAVLPLASGSVFDSQLIQLVSEQETVTTIAEIDGWPVYSADGWAGLDLEEGWSPYVVATDSMVSLIVLKEANSEKGLALITELIRREFSPSRRGARFVNAIAAAEFSLADVVNFMKNDGDEWASVLPTSSDASEASGMLQLEQDQVMWSISLDGHRVVTKCAFQPNALAFGVLCFETFFEVVSDVAEI